MGDTVTTLEAHPWKDDAREAIADVCHRLYDRGYLVATSGNVSVRLPAGFLITPASKRKDAVMPEMVVECRADGAPADASARPSTETAMHREVYTARTDVGAAIHAHPRFSLACSLGDVPLTEMLLPELAVYLGPVPVVPYATPGTEEMATALRSLLPDHNAFLLARHGVLVLGKDLEDAFNRLEHLEHIAQVAYFVRAMGEVQPLTKGEIDKLLRQARHVGHQLSHRLFESR